MRIYTFLFRLSVLACLVASSAFMAGWKWDSFMPYVTPIWVMSRPGPCLRYFVERTAVGPVVNVNRP